MVSWVTASLPSNYLLPRLSAIVDAPAPTLSFSTNLFKVLSCSSRGRISFSLAKRCSAVRTSVVKSNQVASWQDHQGKWEDPDDGSGSEYDEEEEEEEEDDLDYESDWEEEKEASATAISVDESTTNKYEEDLVKGS